MFPYKELLVSLESDIANSGLATTQDFISSDMPIKQVRALALHRSFYKKLAPGGQTEEAQASALKKFIAFNEAIPDGPFEYPVESEQDSVFWDYFRDNMYRSLTPSEASFDLAYMRETFAAGPGSSLKCDNDSFYTKLFASSVTMTDPHLLTLYRGAICESDTWALAERQRHERFGERIVSGNRLFFVPKTTEISRTCCTEPLINMLIQKAIGAFLCDCLKRSFGVSLTTQPDFNRELARIGSIDGSFGTIDLQSASDSIILALIERCVPGNLLGYILLARPPNTVLPDGTEMRLRMVSTMGNGFTFPLQTIIFACAVRAVYQMMNLDSHCPKTQFGVFGDDIVVRREAYDFVVRSLTKLGFKVNDTKSFNTGSFRESCGHDWYNGAFVRGVYIQSLETVSSVYSAINRLNRWSAMAGVPLPSTIACLQRSLTTKHLVPFSEQSDVGIHVPFKMTKPKVDNRYWFSYRKLVHKPKRLKVPESLEESQKLGYRDYNPNGWAVTFMGGFARRDDLRLNLATHGDPDLSGFGQTGAFMTPRSLDDEVRRKVVRVAIPFWDWLGSKEPVEDHFERREFPYRNEPFFDDPMRFFSFSDWENAVAGNHLQ